MEVYSIINCIILLLLLLLMCRAAILDSELASLVWKLGNPTWN